MMGMENWNNGMLENLNDVFQVIVRQFTVTKFNGSYFFILVQ